MKVWPIDPLVPRNLRLEVPEKLPQGLTICPWKRVAVLQLTISQNHSNGFGVASGSGNVYRRDIPPIGHPEVTAGLRPQH